MALASLVSLQGPAEEALEKPPTSPACWRRRRPWAETRGDRGQLGGRALALPVGWAQASPRAPQPCFTSWHLFPHHQGRGSNALGHCVLAALTEFTGMKPYWVPGVSPQ